MENWGPLSDTNFSGIPCLTKMAFSLLIMAELVVVHILSGSKYLL